MNETRLLDLLIRLIERGSQSQFNLLFHKYHEADIADALELLTSEQKTRFFTRIKPTDSVDVFEEIDLESKIEVIQSFKIDNAAELIEKMDKDDAVDLLDALLNEDKENTQNILSKMDIEDQIELSKLLKYTGDTAGTLMTTDFISIPEKLTVKEALALYKEKMPKENDAAFYLFIVNENNQIQGVISLRKLLLSPSGKYVKEIRNDHPITVHVDQDQEEVAKIFQKYRSIALPVVDDLNIVLGVITVDDIVDVVIEEASEDMLKLSGTSGEDIQSNKLIEGGIWYALVHRLPWLGVTLVGGIIASYIMVIFSKALNQSNIHLSLVLSFVPLLMGLAGNVGNQSATILVRAFAINDVNLKRRWVIILREVLIGSSIGILIGIIVGSYVWMTTGNEIFAMSILLAILLNMTIAVLFGAGLPVIFKQINIDPAVASAPFISTALDIIGQIIYYIIVIMLLNVMI